jgi:hypothetical protein
LNASGFSIVFEIIVLNSLCFFGTQNYDKNNSNCESKKPKFLARFLIVVKKVSNPKFIYPLLIENYTDLIEK